jgi:RNA polymerase sigma-70 factor (ECF subfamily)
MIYINANSSAILTIVRDNNRDKLPEMDHDIALLGLQNAQRSLTDMMPDLRRFARSLTGSADAADDLVQSACERVLSRPSSLAAAEQMSSWMYCIIRNVWLDERKSARARLSTPLEDDQHVAPEDTERTVIARSTLNRVRAEMALLPAEQRAAIMLVCVDGLSYQDAATELRIPVGTLMSRLCRGRTELARRIKLPA